MTSRQYRDPVWGKVTEFRIGDLIVAKISFVGMGSNLKGYECILRTLDEAPASRWPTMSAAMKEMHRRLSSPPTDDNKEENER